MAILSIGRRQAFPLKVSKKKHGGIDCFLFKDFFFFFAPVAPFNQKKCTVAGHRK
jgi:hypothetical protein